VYSPLALRVSLLDRFVFSRFLGVYLSPSRASFWLCRLGVPFRRRGSGQERAPIAFLFLHHNISYLGMYVRRLFLILAPKRDEGTIEIHRREGKQSQEGFLFDQRENLRHPRIRAQVGLGQNQIRSS
jgi:hypothetical protein